MDINEILSSLSKEDVEQLKGLASTLLPQQEGEAASKPTGGLGDALGSLGMGGSEDNRTALIKALKPMLSEPKQKKADEAIKLLKLMQLIPLLKGSGILSELL